MIFSICRRSLRDRPCPASARFSRCGAAGLLLLALTVAGCERKEAELRDAAPGGGRFQAADAHVVRDTATGLEWTRRDAGQALAWEAGERHCRSLDAGWRMPEIDELSALYDNAIARPCESGPPCHIDPVFEIGSPYFWSATAAGAARRYYFDFRFGTRLAPRLRPGLTRQVLCVRAGSGG